MVGMRSAQIADVLITLGTRAHIYAESARRANFKSNRIFEFEAIEPVIEWLEKNLTKDDAVLLKGSRGLRMDRITSVMEITK